MKEELLKGLTEEQVKKVKACKNSDELLKLAREEGLELNDEQLAAVSGGSCLFSSPSFVCPKCGSTNIKYVTYTTFYSCYCKDCKHGWDVEN